MDLDVQDYSQWFPGADNNVEDSLSCNFQLLDKDYISYLCHFFPTQMPSRFKIIPLPNEIILWLTSLLQRLPVNELFREEHMQTKHAHGIIGKSTANPLAWRQTFSLTDSTKNIKSKLPEPLQLQCEKEDCRQLLASPWLLEQYEEPSIMWLRPSGNTVSKTQL